MTELMCFNDYIKYLHIGKSKGYMLLKEGEIRGIKIGKKWVIPTRSIAEYLEKNTRIL